ncbi:hypothetical protein DH2020_006399 [Rehmannia glutinosa]|uniref:Retrotransposon Copia-like N-terminal domain-containing protein n=1 Tax=Rehmannia glutinosa TaxID=99300 RepID=A0ABR0XIR8_REHGL
MATKEQTPAEQQPVAQPQSQLVRIKLTESNYLLWKQQILAAVTGYGLEDFLIGEKESSFEIFASEGSASINLTTQSNARIAPNNQWGRGRGAPFQYNNIGGRNPSRGGSFRGRGGRSSSNGPRCQICFRNNHTTDKCFYRMDLGYSPNGFSPNAQSVNLIQSNNGTSQLPFHGSAQHHHGQHHPWLHSAFSQDLNESKFFVKFIRLRLIKSFLSFPTALVPHFDKIKNGRLRQSYGVHGIQQGRYVIENLSKFLSL